MRKLTFLLPAMLLSAFATPVVLAADKPNIIVILSDDQGYADLSCQGILKDIRTPHLDQLAADGIRCTNGYVTAPQCIPSRAGLLSGRYQNRFGLEENGTIPMPLDQILIPERLQQAGYTTGLVGKWHLDPNVASATWIREHLPEQAGKAPARGKSKGIMIPTELSRPYLPDRRGFTEMFCGEMNHYWMNYDLRGETVLPAKREAVPGFRVDVQTEAALAFIDRHADKPFFLHLAYYAPHTPLEATAKYLERFPGKMPERRRTAMAMISAIDDGVGRIRQKLRNHKITGRTLIFFISDNGAPLKIDMADEPMGKTDPGWDGSRNDPWIGEKGMLTEGGIRVPFVVAWPSRIPAGKTYDHPVISLDVGATAVALAGMEKPPELDGINLLPHLGGENPRPPHDALFWRFWNQAAVRKGPWKYLQCGPRRYLFNLDSPEHEKLNRIKEHPEIADQLQAELSTWTNGLPQPGIPKDPPKREKTTFDHYLPQ